ncbi:hypothetical protein RCC89_07895 [Cytophagaceae bacterium ABcell3]|nr:hypothetical protein RCC89_07895 [Cytophagaceae bacterium ABcell3]
MRIHYIVFLLVVFLSSCVSRAYVDSSGEGKKDDKNYHAKTANAIISKGKKNKKKRERKAERKRRKDNKEAAKAGSEKNKKKTVKNPGPFDFY